MKKLSFFAAALFLTASTAFAQTSGEVSRYPYLRTVQGNSALAWKVKKATWSAEDEAEFGRFVARIGRAVESGKCRNFQSCMTKSEVNPYFISDPPGIRYFADCADVPYWLRTYFAFKKGLPFSITVNTWPRDPADPRADNRNSTISGNKVRQRSDSVSASNRFPDITHFLSSATQHGLILDSISSGTLRTPVIPGADEAPADFYPIAINRNSIKPGTVIYTADGHVAVVYKIDDDGNIGTLNGHPADPNAAQSPLSVRDYNDTFKRSRQEHGSIFKNFRPLELVGATPDAQGNLVGGRIVFKTDAQIADASTEQASTSAAADREAGGNYFLMVRRRMANGTLRMDIKTEFRRSLRNVCDLVQGRVELVNQAIAAGMDNRPLPIGPSNIFSTHGDWENYSTPSRDVNIRVLFKKTRDDLQVMVRDWLRNGQSSIYSYSGLNLAQDLYDIYYDVGTSCTVTYTSRSGVRKTMDLEGVRTRMFGISFDPYHCIDLRWGDITTAQQVCGEDVRWYRAQQHLRNLMEKNQDNHALTVEEMEAINNVRGGIPEIDTDLQKYFAKIASDTRRPLTLRGQINRN